MSTTLDYTTIEPVLEPAAAQIMARAQSILRLRDWWCEPLSLAHAVNSKKLRGSTRLWLNDYSLPNGRYQTVPEDEEYLLICSDANFIVGCLSDWSAEFNLSWLLEMNGDEIGQIAQGGASAQLTRFLDGICSMTTLSPKQVPELLKKHAARKS